jgi:hypothetical protein
MENISIEIYTDLKNDELKEKYLNFENLTRNQNITTSYGWISKWWEIFADYNNNKFGFEKQLRIVVLSSNDKIVGIAPLVILKRKVMGYEINFLEFLGQQWGAIYCDFLSNENGKDYLKLILDKLFSSDNIDIVYFNHIPDHSKNFEKDQLIPYAACPEVDLSRFNNMADFRKKRYTKNLNQNIRTAHNRASKSNMTLTSAIKQSNEEYTREVIRISRSKLTDGKDFKYADEKKTQFRIEIMSVFTSNHCFILANNHPIAYRTNVLYNTRKFCVDASYDRDYPKFELGSLSVDANILDSFNCGLKSHCMGPGLDLYKLKFATHIINLNYFIKRGNTIVSLLFYYLLNMKLKKKSSIYKKGFKGLVNSKSIKIDF